MIRGVSFEIPQKTTNTLWKILSAIDISKYFWYCVKNQTEVWNNVFNNDFFSKEYYDGDSFSKCIRFDHYIVFLKLQAHSFPHFFHNIHSYDEFFKSDCQFIILAYDCEFVEIYIKDRIAADSIFKRAKLLGYNNVHYITASNDVRIKMDVL